jgi:hypothetical protein
MEAIMSQRGIHRTIHQPDLFRPTPPSLALPESIRTTVVHLLRRLLQEVTTKADHVSASEIGHDEDYN